MDIMCAEATAMCNSTQDRPQIMVWYYSRAPGQPWQRTGQACIPLAQAGAGTGGGAVPVVTAADFRRLPLPAGVVHVQPGSGRTLVNVPTNVYVAAETVVIPTTVLRQPVRVRAIPVSYLWTFGDGAHLTTTDPGSPYPDLRTTHTYVAPATVRIGLTTTYRGEYSVAGGPWLPVQGTADVVTPGVPLIVIAARSELVDDILPP